MNRLAIVIGRFSPPHRGHILKLFDRARRSCDRALILLGSSFQNGDCKNPFQWEERKILIEMGCTDLLGDCNFHFEGLRDYPESDSDWVKQVRNIVEDHLEFLRFETGENWQPVLIGGNKDASSFYLKLFPNWSSEVFELEASDEPILSATDVRKGLFEERWSDIEKMTTPSIISWLKNWIDTEEGRRIQEEYLQRVSQTTLSP